MKTDRELKTHRATPRRGTAGTESEVAYTADYYSWKATGT
jgi:hypothetical protein